MPFYKTPRENFFLKFYEKGKAGETFHVEEFLGEDCKVHYDYLMTIPVMGDALRELVASGASLPESQYDHIAFLKHGFLLFITYKPVPESHAIFQRFAKVFDQTYTRFLDLQKAEAQAREAQIEAALERVRSKTMAMHSSADVDITVITLFDELVKLGIDKSIRSGIGIWNQSRIVEVWTGSINLISGQTFLDKGVLELGLHPMLTAVKDAWEAKKSTYTYELVGEDLLKYFKAVNDAPDYSLQVDLEKLPENSSITISSFRKGFYLPFPQFRLLMKQQGYSVALPQFLLRLTDASSTCKKQKHKPGKLKSNWRWKE